MGIVKLRRLDDSPAKHVIFPRTCLKIELVSKMSENDLAKVKKVQKMDQKSVKMKENLKNANLVNLGTLISMSLSGF